MGPNPIIREFRDAAYTAVLRWLDHYIKDGYIFGHDMGFGSESDRIKVLAKLNINDNYKYDIFEINDFDKLGTQVNVSIGYIKLIVNNENSKVSAVQVFIYDKIPIDQNGRKFMLWLSYNICDEFELADPTTRPFQKSAPIKPPDEFEREALRGVQRQEISKIEQVEIKSESFSSQPDHHSSKKNRRHAKDELLVSQNQPQDVRKSKKRRGGPVPPTDEEKLALVREWKNTHGNETQESFCNRKGIGVSTLGKYKRELEASGLL